MKRFVDKVDAKAHAIGQHIDYRLDAGYTSGSVMNGLAAPPLKRPAGRPPMERNLQMAAGPESLWSRLVKRLEQWPLPTSPINRPPLILGE